MRDGAHQAPKGQRDGQRIVEPPQPLPVRVWVQAGQSGDQLCDGHAVAWTAQQVHVRYLDKHGRQGWAWVWANAVTRR